MHKHTRLVVASLLLLPWKVAQCCFVEGTKFLPIVIYSGIRAEGLLVACLADLSYALVVDKLIRMVFGARFLHKVVVLIIIVKISRSGSFFILLYLIYLIQSVHESIIVFVHTFFDLFPI